MKSVRYQTTPNAQKRTHGRRAESGRLRRIEQIVSFPRYQSANFTDDKRPRRPETPVGKSTKGHMENRAPQLAIP